MNQFGMSVVLAFASLMPLSKLVIADATQLQAETALSAAETAYNACDNEIGYAHSVMFGPLSQYETHADKYNTLEAWLVLYVDPWMNDPQWGVEATDVHNFVLSCTAAMRTSVDNFIEEYENADTLRGFHNGSNPEGCNQWAYYRLCEAWNAMWAAEHWPTWPYRFETYYPICVTESGYAENDATAAFSSASNAGDWANEFWEMNTDALYAIGPWLP